MNNFDPSQLIKVQPDSILHQNIDTSKLMEYAKQNPIMPNIPKPEIPKIQTFEERIKPVTDRLDSVQKELESQTIELEKMRYENIKLNAQVDTLNKTNDKQLTEISDLKAADIISKNTILSLNKTISDMEKSNKYNWIKDLGFAVLGGVIVLLVEYFILPLI